MPFLAAVLALSLNPATNAVVHRMSQTGAPVVSVAIVHDGRIVYERGFGVRKVNGPPVDVNTRFEIGSLTKQFTAAAILQLKEQGRLKLGDRLSKYVPGFPHASEITLLQLLHQTTGLPDFVETNHFVAISHTTPGSFVKIERMACGPLHFTPGSKWEYSNTNYIALGRVIEVVSGEPYAGYVARHLFAPAGMTHSATVAQAAGTPDMATGYWRGLHMKGPLVVAPAAVWPWFWSAGGLISTAGDIARWDIALQSGKIITPQDFTLMTTPVRLSNGTIGDYGFHWWTDPLHGHRLFSGLGDTYGSSSANDIFPDAHLGVVVLENVSVDPNGESDAAGHTAAAIFEALTAPSSG